LFLITNNKIKISFNNGQLLTHYSIQYLILKIKNKNYEQPIKDNIKVTGNYYFWNRNHINKYLSQEKSKQNIIVDL